MTVDLPPATPATSNSATADGAPLTRVDPGYRNVVRLHMAVAAIGPVVAAIVLDLVVLQGTSLRWLPTGLLALVVALALLATAIVPARKYRRLGYALSGNAIRIMRGYLFHVDTVVPFIRVQHIDVARGPIERMFGIASLVVHTAGTHNSIVTLPGLSPDTAAAIRDTIRGHIRTDFE